MIQSLTYLSSRLGITSEKAKLTAKSIADSYQNARIYAGTDEKAAEWVIKDSKKAFGFNIDDQILDASLKYVKKFEGNISSEEFINENRIKPVDSVSYAKNDVPEPIYNVEDSSGRFKTTVSGFVKSTYKGAKRGLEDLAETVGKPHFGYDTPLPANAGVVRAPSKFKSGIRTGAAYALLASLGAAYTISNAVRQDNEYPTHNKPKSVIAMLSDVIQPTVHAQGAPAPVISPPPAPAGQTAGTQAGSSATGQTVVSQAGTSQTLAEILENAQPGGKIQFYDIETGKLEDYKMNFAKRTEENDKAECEGGPLSKFSNKIQKWYSLLAGSKTKPLKAEYKEESGKYTTEIIPPVSYKGNDAQQHKNGVRFLDTNVYVVGLKSNSLNSLEVPQKFHDNEIPIGQQVLYTKNGNTLDIHASTNIKVTMKKKADCDPKVTPPPVTPPPAVPTAPPVAPLVNPPEQTLDLKVIGIPFTPENDTDPNPKDKPAGYNPDSYNNQNIPGSTNPASNPITNPSAPINNPTDDPLIKRIQEENNKLQELINQQKKLYESMKEFVPPPRPPELIRP